MSILFFRLLTESCKHCSFVLNKLVRISYFIVFLQIFLNNTNIFAQEIPSDAEAIGLITRKLPRTYHITTKLFATKNTISYANRNSLQTIISIPVPRNEFSHEINNLHYSHGKIENLNSLDDLQLIVDSNKPIDEVTLEYDITTYEIESDLTRINTIYPYDTFRDDYKDNLGIQGSQVNPKNPQIVRIARKLKSKSKNNLEYILNSYKYIQSNLKWKNRGNYDSIDNIFKNGGGDCGALSGIFISLLRYNNIPARYLVGGIISEKESTWEWHAWAEFYLEKYGWIPADPSVFYANASYIGQQSNRHVFFNHSNSNRFYVDSNLVTTGMLQRFWYYLRYFDNSVKGTIQYDMKVVPTLTASSDESKFFNDPKYQNNIIINLMKHINSVRQKHKLSALKESSLLNETAQSVVERKFKENISLNPIEELKKGNYTFKKYALQSYTYPGSYQNSIQIIHSTEKLEKYIVNMDYNEIGIGYFYDSRTKQHHHYFILTDGAPSNSEWVIPEESFLNTDH